RIRRQPVQTAAGGRGTETTRQTMSPYLRAYEAYHSDGEPYIPWSDALDFHLQKGVVISDERVFLMARRVRMDWPDEDHVSFRVADDGNDWHVWAAAGTLSALLPFIKQHGAGNISFQRRHSRIRRL